MKSHSLTCGRGGDLIDLIERHDSLMNWWAAFLADCATRKARRENKWSARSLKSAATRRRKMMEANPFKGETL